MTKRNLFACSGLIQNGLIDPGEECDDGNNSDTVLGIQDGCSTTCNVQTGFICENSINIASTCTPICGDGLKVGNETCDDGNISNNDGCSSLCQLQTHGTRYNCTTNTANNPATVCIDNCGDGYDAYKDMNSVPLTGRENYCDDGNLTPGDGYIKFPYNIKFLLR